MTRTALLIVLALSLSACGTATRWTNSLFGSDTGGPALITGDGGANAQIVATNSHLECVPYARSVTGVGIRGDAWTWWDTAKGRYPRGIQPSVGAILVLRRTNRLSGGHLAVVSEVRSPREIVVRHANWLNNGNIHLNTPIRDESAANDWSLVRIWYTPGRVYGASRYAAHGFIYPERQTAMR